MAAKIDTLLAHGLPHWHGKCYYLLFVWLA
jgi:hypothetical protein